MRREAEHRAPAESRRNQQNIEGLTAAALKQRIISTLSLARKAGRLTAGADAVSEAVRSGQAGAVFIAADLSPRSQKNIRYVCQPLSVPVIPLKIAMDEMAAQIGRRSGILAVADDGFERKLRSLLEQAERLSAAESGETAESLS